uniref:Uridylate kinase n=1 Tax=Phenylobacterium glaciei TaxID=2803784 RepID=A0A974P0W7_9CAUL|nr:UMP kinase [Phenylobacterium glaciei]
MSDAKPRYKKILLKMSGEVLMGDALFGIDTKTIEAVAADIKEVVDAGVELCLVVGGGNIFRGVSWPAGHGPRQRRLYGHAGHGDECAGPAGALEKAGVDTRVQSAIPMDAVCEPYIRRRAQRHIEKGRVVIFAAGLGAPFFTTDTPAALRTAEMGCDALFKGTSVDGVYTADPKKDPSARRYETLSYQDVLAQDLRVMDASAIALMRDNNVPIVVFSIRERATS